MDQKGQASVDLLFATFLLFIIVSSVINVISSGADTASNAQFSKAKVLADNLSRSIDSVYSNGNGQYLIFSLPGDFNYTVMVNNPSISSNATVAVSYNNNNNKRAISNLIPSSANIADNYGSNQITMAPNEKYNITNNNGNITFTKLS